MENDVTLPNVDEPTRTFKLNSDREGFLIQSEETGEVLVEVSGYDLQFNFNMQYLKTIEDITAACEGIRKLFQDQIMTMILEQHNQSEDI